MAGYDSLGKAVYYAKRALLAPQYVAEVLAWEPGSKVGVGHAEPSAIATTAQSSAISPGKFYVEYFGTDLVGTTFPSMPA
jgi:hypothetical protein